MTFFGKQVIIGNVDAYGEVEKICRLRGFEEIEDEGEIWIQPFSSEKVVKRNSFRTIYKIPGRDAYIFIGTPGGRCLRIEGRDTEDIVFALKRLGFERGCISGYSEVCGDA